MADVDLSGRWAFVPEGGGRTTIAVPGGGWLKQGFRCEAGVYETDIAIPAAPQPQAFRLELGAVNHAAEYFLGGTDGWRPLHQEVTAFTPQVVDLTPHVVAGKTYPLRIAVRAWRDGRPVAPHCAEWCGCIARGIFRSAWLRVYPEVFIDEVFIRTSVAQGTLGVEAWLTNAGERPRQVQLAGQLRADSADAWAYPELPALDVLLEPGQTRRVRLPDVAWTCGPASYWWPNVPYRAGYRTRLHHLTLHLTVDGARGHTRTTRFGFRELRQAGDHFELNGLRVNFRGDNLQVANYDRIDHGGRGDAIDTLPGFLPPGPGCPGWPGAVDNFLRLNFTVQRQHMGPWTPYMLDVCDELGLMLIGESACRWNGFDMEDGVGFHEVKCLQDLVRRDRCHPSIVRWCAKNEAQNADPGYHVALYEAIKAVDDTRPVHEDFLTADRDHFDPLVIFAPLLVQPDFTWIEHYLASDAAGRPYFTALHHNDAVVPLEGRPYGIGEADWLRGSTPAGLTWWATSVALFRAAGASDARPYTLLSSWASCIPGVRHTDFVTEENRYPLYGEDNLPDPFGHAGIQLLQTACHPRLALDVEFWRLNRAGDAWGHFPVHAPALQAGTQVERTVLVFNDQLPAPRDGDPPSVPPVGGSALLLRWEVREGHPGNRLWARGQEAVAVPYGEAAATTVRFATPPCNTQLFVRLVVEEAGRICFQDDRLYYEVTGGRDYRAELDGEERTFL